MNEQRLTDASCSYRYHSAIAVGLMNIYVSRYQCQNKIFWWHAKKIAVSTVKKNKNYIDTLHLQGAEKKEPLAIVSQEGANVLLAVTSPNSDPIFTISSPWYPAVIVNSHHQRSHHILNGTFTRYVYVTEQFLMITYTLRHYRTLRNIWHSLTLDWQQSIFLFHPV